MNEKLVRVDVTKIQDPDFVKNLGPKSLTILSHDIRQEIIKSTARSGGHLSSNLGDVELTLSLFRVFDFKRKDKLIFDVGHQSYTQKLLTGRSLEDIGGQGKGSRFQSRSESPYDVYEAGHSSTSLSAALAFAIRETEKGDDRGNVVAVIGDASIASGLAFEGLNNIAANSAKVIVVLNDNDMSISSPAGALGRFFRKISSQKFYNKAKKAYQRTMNRTKLGRYLYKITYKLKDSFKRHVVPTTLFDNLGLTYIGPVNGHSVKALDKAFERAKNTTKSAIVHVYTKKGKGYAPAENDKKGLYHGVPPFDIATGGLSEPGKPQWPGEISSLLLEKMRQDASIRLVCPAMIVGSSLSNIYEEFPKRCFDTGIAEEHAATFAGALGAVGYRPVLCVYSTFLQRAYDEILHDCARLKSPLTLLIDRAGPVGKDGETHQGLYDVAFLASIPNVVVTQPCSVQEAGVLLTQALASADKVFAIRYPKEDAYFEDTRPELAPGRFRRLKQGGRNAVIGVGPRGRILYESLKTNEDVAFAEAVYLNEISDEDVEWLLGFCKVAVYDSYSTASGFGKNLSLKLLERGYKGSFRLYCFPDEFVGHAEIAEQLGERGLDPESVLASVSSFFQV